MQLPPLAIAQVFVTGLHALLTHAAAARVSSHTPLCNTPSAGKATPGLPLPTQLSRLRSQYCAVPQSSSTKHPPDVEGMQVPETLHAPDWQREAVVALQPASPVATPQTPLAAQVPNWHCGPTVHDAPTGSAQVLLTRLHSPLAQVSAPPLRQVPSCSPSEGIAVPAGSFVVQV